MSERLRSIGVDVGTTSTQVVFSELTVENRASAFAVPEMEIVSREILYRSPVHFTPLMDENHVDACSLRTLLEEEYRKAGMRPEDVDTGAVIVTGETSRKENARAVLEALADFSGEFVVTTAGPDLESVLAARGSGAVAFSGESGKLVVHMDIGGGTSNLALVEDGKILQTTCLNVGGRLVKYDRSGVIAYISPVLRGIWEGKVGQTAKKEDLRHLADILVRALEMAAGLRRAEPLLAALTTAETAGLWKIPEGAVISFSGGVADCIGEDRQWNTYGDLGPILGQAIRESRLCTGEYVLGKETIRATVIGAGCHSAQLSGSTVFHRNVTFPLKDLSVVHPQPSAESIRMELQRQEGTAVIALTGRAAPTYGQVAALAEEILAGTDDRALYLCLEQDMAKALGQALAARTGPERPILCIDRVRVPEGSFLDVGAPVGPAMPVVVKTLVLGGK